MAESTRSVADAARGLAAAGAVLGLWGLCTALLFATPSLALPLWLVPAAVLTQTFLFTGLFITAHDGMHGTICPRWPRLNDAIGALAVGLYAAFRYDRLRAAHRRHHATPAQAGADPDYHDGEHDGPLRWYLAFMLRYLTVWQVLIMAAVFNVLQHGLGVELPNLLLFWVLPALLSTGAAVLRRHLAAAPRPAGRTHLGAPGGVAGAAAVAVAAGLLPLRLPPRTPRATRCALVAPARAPGPLGNIVGGPP